VIWRPGIRCAYHDLHGDVMILKSYGTGAWVSTACLKEWVLSTPCPSKTGSV